MADLKRLLRDLGRYALAKPGATHDAGDRDFGRDEYTEISVPGSEWTAFLMYEEGAAVTLPVLADRLREWQAEYPGIRLSNWVERDGHVCMDVPLDTDIPVAAVEVMIDEAHAIVWAKLDATAKLLVQLADLPYDEPALIDRLIDMHGLADRLAAIHALAKPALLLRTKRSSDAKLPVGTSKLGGKPDLPPDVAWPTFDGKPLAFLAQLDLAAVATAGPPIPGLPTSGLMSLFSAWGWVDPDEGLDPQPPPGEEGEQAGWTVVLHLAAEGLERRKQPRGVRPFKAAAVELVPVRSLPNHRTEPPLAALGWTDDGYERFDTMQSDFRALQSRHWLKNAGASYHLLGGYALFQQYFPEELPGSGRSMLLQIGSDEKAAMCWGDDGELTFYADAQALAGGRFERVWGTCQCG